MKRERVRFITCSFQGGIRKSRSLQWQNIGKRFSYVRFCASVAFCSFLLFTTANAFAAQAKLTWTDTSTNEAEFDIERKAEACLGTALPFTQIVAMPSITVIQSGITVTFIDTTVVEPSPTSAPGTKTTYCYRVAAANAAGKSAFSNTAEISFPLSIPSVPINLTISP